MTIAINNTTDSYVGMEHFLGWDVDEMVFKVSIWPAGLLDLCISITSKNVFKPKQF